MQLIAKTMDYITINNLFFRGKHGVYDAERKVEQEFHISLKLGFDAAKSAASDKLADTVDYDEVKREVREVIEGGSRYFIEALAEDITARVFKDARIQSVEVSIQKTAVWDNGVPGVIIVRTKN